MILDRSSDLDRFPCLTLRYVLPLIKMEEYRSNFNLTTDKGDLLTIETLILINAGRKVICFKWSDETSEKHSQSVEIAEARSNLNGAKVYYFLVDGRKCRKLYFHTGKFRTRQEIGGKYLSQHLTDYQKREYIRTNEPRKRHGKTTGRGTEKPPIGAN